MNNLEREKEWLLREKHGGVESDTYRDDVARLESGEPVDYVIGFSQFLGCRIDLSHRTLIPRTETEYWVDIAIKELTEKYGREAKLQMLDIFSGSGCIGVAVLKHFPNATIDFVDIEENAVLQIRKNLEINSIDPTRCAVYQSDIFQNIPEKKYDVIFANPPYIAEKGRVDTSVLDYEPHRALFADDNGLALINRLAVALPDRLAQDGVAYVEHDDFHKEELERVLSERALSFSFFKDQFGVWRWVRVCFDR